MANVKHFFALILPCKVLLYRWLFKFDYITARWNAQISLATYRYLHPVDSLFMSQEIPDTKHGNHTPVTLVTHEHLTG